MAGFIVRRLGQLALVLLGMVVVTFYVSHVIPGDPARLAAGLHATQSQVMQVKKEFGLNLPLTVQFWRYLVGLLHGNLGISILTRNPVSQDLATYFPATVELTVSAMAIVVVVGLPLGVASAVRRGKLTDHLSRLFALLGVSMPPFWLAILLQVVFGQDLGWFPISGMLNTFLVPPPHITGIYLVDSLLTGNWPDLLSSLTSLVLPAFTLAFGSIAIVTRMVRANLLEAMRQDFIRTARAKGVSEGRVIYRHALRNALLPTLTVVGLQTGSLLSGAVLVEAIFAWPGIGSYALQASEGLDFPAILGFTLLVAVVYVVINTLVDLLYTLVDPRIRYA
jgi:peptide/nickel transport system permease protein